MLAHGGALHFMESIILPLAFSAAGLGALARHQRHRHQHRNDGSAANGQPDTPPLRQ